VSTAEQATPSRESARSAQRVRRVAIIGNPNTGKSTLFNALTGLNARVGNYPGVTVEKKTGALAPGLELLDLPGTYSLAAHSPDEMVAVNVLLGGLDGEPRPDLVIVIADASNLQRNLFLATQVLETGLPVVLALNMVDAAKQAGITVDAEKLGAALGVPVIPTVASSGEGVQKLRDAIQVYLGTAPPQPKWTWPEPLAREIGALTQALSVDRFLAARALIDEGGAAEDVLCKKHDAARAALAQARARLKAAGQPPAKLEIQMRYAWIAQAIGPCMDRHPTGARLTDRLDHVLTHRLLGTLIFVALMTLVFVTIFVAAEPFMDQIEAGFTWLGKRAAAAFAGTSLEGGTLQSLVVKGVIAGVGGVLVFLPQIAFLFCFIALLEDCGYMARAAFLMDRVLRFCGLSGHSFIPMMSSFACAIPGIMATRTISNPRDRLTTMLIAPLMSCSARIPVYGILCDTFVPHEPLHGFLPALVFAAMYFVGILTAIPVALILKKTLLKGPTPPFVMELPPYRMPLLGSVWRRVWDASKAFTVRAGTVIFAITVVLWALLYFPHSKEIAVKYEDQRAFLRAEDLPEEETKARLAELDKQEAGAHLRNSVLGRAGHCIEPAVKPLGWDWRIGVAALASFPAREVVVSTLRIIYDLGPEEGGGAEEEGDGANEAAADGAAEAPPENADLAEKLQASTWPDGRKVYTLPVALGLMVFFALCAQCAATLVTIKKESGSWKWAVFTFVYMTALAYAGALLTYQVGTALLG